MKKFTSLIVATLATTLFTLAPAAQADVLTFREGVDSYAGTADTLIRNDNRLSHFGGFTSSIYMRGPVTTGGTSALHGKAGLFRFDDIFGAGASQIGSGQVISSATLTLSSSGGVAAPGTMQVRAMLTPWIEGSTTGAPAQNGEVNYSYRGYDHNTGGGSEVVTAYWGNLNQIEDGPVSGVDYMNTNVYPTFTATGGAADAVDITDYIAAWYDDFYGQAQSGALAPMANNGMLIDGTVAGAGGWFRISEFGTVAERPMLTVTFVPEPASLGLVGLGGLLIGMKRRK